MVYTASSPTSAPDNFFCPITQEIMREPVLAGDGYTYERSAIKQWIAIHKISFKTKKPLKHRHLTPNYTLINLIKQWRASFAVSSPAVLQNQALLQVGAYRASERGIVFHLDVPARRGLVVAIRDCSPCKWATEYTVTGATNNDLYEGKHNTNKLLSLIGGPFPAAKAARAYLTYPGNHHTDWFLPSKDELKCLYDNRVKINYTACANGGQPFINNGGGRWYWSSSEDPTNPVSKAWLMSFDDSSHGVGGYDEKNATVSVRAIRIFIY